MAKKKKSAGGSFAETCASAFSGAISCFIFLLVMVFPLIYHDSYFDILETKYRCYYLCVIGMMAVCLVMAISMAAVDRKEHGGTYVKRLLAGLAPKQWKKTFCAADAAVLVFWLTAVISTCQSEYRYEAFWGNEGRYTGLFLLTLYVISYFLISRCWKMRAWLLDAFLISGMLMCFVGITDYFQMDILSFRIYMNPKQYTMFTSTVGNINTYTAYVALIMGFSAAMFGTAKGTWRVLWYYACMAVSFMAIIMGCSDNAYLALGALFVFLPFVLFKTWRGMLRYLIMTATFFTVTQCVDKINQAYEETVVGLDSLFQIIVGFSGLPMIVAGLWIAVVGFYILVEKDSKMDSNMGKWPVRIWSVFVIACVVIVCVMMVDANLLGNGKRYGSLGTYLVFNDSWGTNRGYIWRKSVELYRDFPAMHKLFGYGPDTFGILVTKEIRAEMVQATSQVFDTAHNEYLQLLVTMGLFGVISYVAFGILALVTFCRNLKKHPYLIGCIAAIICYSAQALVNLNLPIVAPILWLMLSVGMAVCREKN